MAVDKCWARLPQDDAENKAVYDSAHLPVDVCLRTVSIKIDGDRGTLTATGVYAPAGGSERRALTAKPLPLSGYKSSDGARVFAAYVFEESNSNGDAGAAYVEFRVGVGGRVVPGSLWTSFSVGCPHERCVEGDEPGARTVVKDWPR